MPILLRAMRPGQWTKNAVVAAAFFFALGDQHQAGQLRPLWAAALTVAAAMAVFCLASSGIYLFNDVLDAEEDRRHPLKKFRPVASGRLPARSALAAAGLLVAVALGAALSLSLSLRRPFAVVVAGYALMQVVYSLWLKRIALVDIFVIAAGFVLRALAGAVVLAVAISPWLLVCTLLLALFLALCKRRHEKVVLGETADTHRASMQRYDRRLLDQLIAIVSSATIVSYSIYTLSAETVAKFGTAALGFTIPFVIFGIFRYLDLVYRHDQGDRPERILLTDVPLIIDVALYGVTVLCILKWLH